MVEYFVKAAVVVVSSCGKRFSIAAIEISRCPYRAGSLAESFLLYLYCSLLLCPSLPMKLIHLSVSSSWGLDKVSLWFCLFLSLHLVGDQNWLTGIHEAVICLSDVNGRAFPSPPSLVSELERLHSFSPARMF